MFKSTSVEFMTQEEKLYPTVRVKKGKMDLRLIEILMWIQYWDNYSNKYSKNTIRNYKEETIHIYIQATTYES